MTDHKVRLDAPSEVPTDTKPTLYALVMALYDQQEAHTQALARIGIRLSDAEGHINSLLREVGREPDSDVRERVVGGGP